MENSLYHQKMNEINYANLQETRKSLCSGKSKYVKDAPEEKPKKVKKVKNLLSLVKNS